MSDLSQGAIIDNTGGSSSLPTPSAEPAKAPALANPTPVMEGPGDVSDADLLGALRSSREARPPEPTPDDASEAPSAPAGSDAPAPAAAAPPADPKLAAAVDAALAQRLQQNEARERELRQYRDQGSRIVSEAEAYAAQRKKQADAEYEQLIVDLRKDPIAAAKKAGWDPVALVENIANYDSPQGRIEREVLATKAELAQMRAEQTARIKADEAARMQAQANAQRQQVADTFLGEVKTKYPGAEEHLKRPGMQDFYLQQAHKRADELAAERGPGGQLTYGEIADWLATTYGFGQAPTPPKGAPAPTAAGKAARSLNQAAQSERSGGDVRAFHELSEAEQDRILLAEQKTRRQREATSR
jgi:hypothetical protein